VIAVVLNVHPLAELKIRIAKAALVGMALGHMGRTHGAIHLLTYFWGADADKGTQLIDS